MFNSILLVFIDEPGPGPVIQPLGKNVQLKCRVSQGFRTQWTFQFFGQNSVISSDETGVVTDLRRRGITIQISGSNTVLNIYPSVELNRTQIRCLAVHFDNVNSRLQSRIVNVTIYGTYSIIHVVNIDRKYKVLQLRGYFRIYQSIEVVIYIITSESNCKDSDYTLTLEPHKIIKIMNHYNDENMCSSCVCHVI